MNEMIDFQQGVGEWGIKTFHHSIADCGAIVNHIKKEVDELELQVAYGNSLEIVTECADIYILLLHIAHLHDIDLMRMAKWKMSINAQREWKEPDKDGVVEHVKESP